MLVNFRYRTQLRATLKKKAFEDAGLPTPRQNVQMQQQQQGNVGRMAMAQPWLDNETANS